MMMVKLRYVYLGMYFCPSTSDTSFRSRENSYIAMEHDTPTFKHSTDPNCGIDMIWSHFERKLCGNPLASLPTIMAVRSGKLNPGKGFEFSDISIAAVE